MQKYYENKVDSPNHELVFDVVGFFVRRGRINPQNIHGST